MPYVGKKPADIIATAVDTTTGKFSGVVDADAGITVDNITIDGTEIDLSSGDLTLDVAGNIILDADGGNWKLMDAGTEIGRFYNDAGLNIWSVANDTDIKFLGTDGGSAITALTLDMSAAGEAKFNDNIVMGTAGKGIHLGVTSATASNLLDDYEEGTWTAKIAGNDGNESDTTVTGNYTKIGNLVYAEFASLNNVNTTGIGSSAILNIKTLPFTVGNTGALGHISANLLNFSTSTNVNINVSASASSTIMTVVECNDNGSRNSLAIASITDDQTDFSQVTIMYRTA